MTATSSKWNENFILMYEKKKEKKKPFNIQGAF